MKGLLLSIYENTIPLNIKIKYPSTWVYSEENLYLDNVVRFSPASVIFNITEDEWGVYVYVGEAYRGSYPLQNMPLELFVKENKRVAQDAMRKLNYTESVSAKLENGTLPAHKNILTFRSNDGYDVKAMEILTVKNGKSYDFEYSSDPKKFDQYLPIAQRMIDSLQITN